MTFQALWNETYPAFAEVVHVFMWFFTIVGVCFRMLLGKLRKNKQLSCVTHISVRAYIVSTVFVKRQLPFVGGRVLEDRARGSVLNSTPVWVTGSWKPSLLQKVLSASPAQGLCRVAKQDVLGFSLQVKLEKCTICLFRLLICAPFVRSSSPVR